MATMYALFLGLLFIALCSPLGPGDGALGVRGACYEVRGSGFGLREKIVNIASAELGVREATGRNDGKRVEEYLAYTDLGKGHAWCAAFVSWCYGQAGLPAPRNPWSPALFPKARAYWKNGVARSHHVSPKGSNSTAMEKLENQCGEKQIGHQIFWMYLSKSIQKIYRPCMFQRGWDRAINRLGIGQRPWSLGLFQGLGPSGHEDGKVVGRGKPEKINLADIFGIYSSTAKRINHVGLVKGTEGKYIVTIEGNSNDRVESRRRHLSTIYALADWVD